MWKERTFRIYTNGACGWHNILCSGANCALWWSKSNNEEDFTAWKKKKCQRHSQNLPNAYLSTITNIATASVCVCVCMCTKPGRKWTDDRLPKYIINQAMSNNEPEIKNLVKTINWVIEIINNPVRLIFCMFSIALWWWVAIIPTTDWIKRIQHKFHNLFWESSPISWCTYGNMQLRGKYACVCLHSKWLSRWHSGRH